MLETNSIFAQPNAHGLVTINMTGIHEVLRSLKQASRDLKHDPSDQDSAGFSNKQLMLQIAALHKGLMALSEAFLENIEASRQQSAAWDGGLEALRREFLSKMEMAQALHEDLQQLVTLEAGLQAQAGLLGDRVGVLEEQVGSLHLQLDQQGSEVTQAIQNEVTQAANTHFEEHLQHFEQERLQPLAEAALRRHVQQWAANELGALVREELRQQAEAAVKTALQQELQTVQAGLDAAHEACSGAAEVATHAAASVAALAGDVQYLTEWCQRVDAAHANHEDRLRLLEEAGGASCPEATPAVTGRRGAAGQGEQQLQQQVAAAVLELQGRLGRLELTVQQNAAAAAAGPRGGPEGPGSRRGHPGGGPLPPAAAAPAGESTLAGSGLNSWAIHEELAAVELQLADVQRRMQNAGAAGEDSRQMSELQGQLQELAVQQAQQRKSAEDMVHAVLTDVMALARHTRALDGEVRALRGGVGKVQDALLNASGTFAKALGIASPVGPFTTFS